MAERGWVKPLRAELFKTGSNPTQAVRQEKGPHICGLGQASWVRLPLNGGCQSPLASCLA